MFVSFESVHMRDDDVCARVDPGFSAHEPRGCGCGCSCSRRPGSNSSFAFRFDILTFSWRLASRKAKTASILLLWVSVS